MPTCSNSTSFKKDSTVVWFKPGYTRKAICTAKLFVQGL